MRNVACSNFRRRSVKCLSTLLIDARQIKGDRGMDGTRFDSLTRTLGALADRRATVRALSGAAIGVFAPSSGADAKKKKKKCKRGQKKCGKTCCPLGQFCRSGKCSICPPPLFVCPIGGCAETLCGGQCCAVRETCVDNQCAPCPDQVNSCGVDAPRCNNGSGFCATSVEGGTFCVSAAPVCSPCASNDDCADGDDFAICGTCNSCDGANRACFVTLPE
jgi:hypothetical protein